MDESAQKAQRMVGLGPFRNRDIEEHCANERDFDKVKMNMVREHLEKIYKYDEEEIKMRPRLQLKRRSTFI